MTPLPCINPMLQIFSANEPIKSLSDLLQQIIFLWASQICLSTPVNKQKRNVVSLDIHQKPLTRSGVHKKINTRSSRSAKSEVCFRNLDLRKPIKNITWTPPDGIYPTNRRKLSNERKCLFSQVCLNDVEIFMLCLY